MVLIHASHGVDDELERNIRGETGQVRRGQSMLAEGRVKAFSHYLQDRRKPLRGPVLFCWLFHVLLTVHVYGFTVWKLNTCIQV
jgi:hypothetical protein